MFPRLLVLLCLMGSLAPMRADEAKTLAPFFDERTVSVLRLDLRKLDVARLVELVATKATLKPAALARTTKEWSALVEGLVQDGADVVYLVTSLADVPEDYPFLVVPIRKDAKLDRLSNRLAELKQIKPTIGVSRLGQTLIVGSAAVFKRVQMLKPLPRPDIVKALATDAGLARLVIVPTTDARRVLEETLPSLPDEIGGGSIRPLSRGLQWLSLDVDAPPKLGVRFTVQTTDADAAQAIDRIVQRILKQLAAEKSVVAVVPQFGKLASMWKAKRDEGRLTVTLDEKRLVEVLAPYVEQLIITERQARSSAQMRQLLTAMHGYEKKHNTFPANASYDRKGRPLLSWRVHLLPYLGEDRLYREFRLDEPWDSPHNRKLLAKMPAVYRPMSEKVAKQSRTTLLAPVGEMTMFPPGRGVRVAEVADGTVHTILLVDAADDRAVEWTRPADLPVEEKARDLSGRLARRHGGQMLVGMADGTARFLPGTMAAWSLWALLTRAGGEVVELP